MSNPSDTRLTILKVYKDIQRGTYDHSDMEEVSRGTDREDYLFDVVTRTETIYRELHALFVQEGEVLIPLWDKSNWWYPAADNYLS